MAIFLNAEAAVEGVSNAVKGECAAQVEERAI
jgi:hypothetical protein